MQIIFHHVARAVIQDQGRILLATGLGGNVMMPGGHVELGEGAEAALRRELHEELGLTSVEVGRFLGVVELTKEIAGVLHHEVGHYFEVHADGLSADQAPLSQEPELSFFWTELSEDNLKKVNVLPEPLQEFIPRVMEVDKALWWSAIRS